MKEPKKFIDENGEECRYATARECAVFMLACVLGLAGLFGLLWFSQCFAHFLKTGGWTWL